MKKQNKNFLLTLVQKQTQRQINNTIEGKCIFLCYEPRIPQSLKKKLK